MRRIRFGVLGISAAVLVATFLAAPGAEAGKPTAGTTHLATHIGVSVKGQDLSSIGTQGTVGNVYIVRGTPFEVDLGFLDAAGDPAPLSTNKDTTVTVSVTNGPDQGTLATFDVPAGATSASSSDLVLPDAANAVLLTATAPAAKHTTISGSAAPFDVLLASTTGGSIGGDSTSDGCAPTPADPVCADLHAPASGFRTGTLLSTGVCTGLKDCAGTFVQALAGLDTTDQDPATLVMKCDKTLCGGGSIKRNQLVVNLAPGSPDVTAPSCPSKGTVGTDQTFCVDYVQSTRDNAGDTILYLLFTQDAKIRFS